MTIRVSLMAAAVVGMAALAPQPAHAVEGPWCSIHPMGPDGGVIEDCHYRSVEECRPNVISGNRGWCGQNPRWPGYWAPKQQRVQRRSR
jgi:hypothetical protein